MGQLQINWLKHYVNKVSYLWPSTLHRIFQMDSNIQSLLELVLIFVGANR